MWEYPVHFGWYHPWAGGPGTYRNAGWASLGEQASSQLCYPEMVDEINPFLPTLLLVTVFITIIKTWLGPQLYDFEYSTKHRRLCLWNNEKKHLSWVTFGRCNEIDHLGFALPAALLSLSWMPRRSTSLFLFKATALKHLTKILPSHTLLSRPLSPL